VYTIESLPAQSSDSRQATQPPRRGSSQNAPVETIGVTAQAAPTAPQAAPAGTQEETLNMASAAPVAADTPARPLTMVEQLRAQDDLIWSRAVAKMQEAAQLIDEAIAAGDFDTARRLAEGAIQVIEAGRGYASPASKYEEARRMALDLRDWVVRSSEEAAMRKADEQRRSIAEQLTIRRTQQEQLRIEKVEQLFNTARQLEQERRFGEAAEAIRQLLSLDPANDNARLALDLYEEFDSLASQLEVDREASRQQRRVFSNTEAAKIPWGDDILYPKNWLEISARRDRSQNDGGGSGDDFELNRTLEDVQPEVSFTDQPFDQIVDFLVDLNQINMSVDWEDLELAGIERDKPVTIKLREVALRTVLDEVLAQVGGDVHLAYAVGDGLLRVATKDKLDRDKYILVFDIRDLLVRVPRFRGAPRIDLTQQSTGGAGGGNVFGGSSGGGGQNDDDENQGGGGQNGGVDDEQVQELLDIIRQTVEPDSWRETGGGEGALRELNGQLIVYNTSDAQRQIRDLLGQLRRQRALMINVESRFLTVASNFLEEIGVDLDFVFNSGNAGFDPAFNNAGSGLFDPFTGSRVLIPRAYSQAGVFPAVPGVGTQLTQTGSPAQPFGNAAFVPQNGGIIPSSDYFTPIGAQQGSLNLVNPTQLNTGIPGSIAQAANFVPALNIAGSFLDNLQVDFLIRATQASRRSSVVQAPRLMLFNGQRAWVAITRDRQYVSTVTPVVAEGAVGVTPVPATVSSGSALDVEGTISADRKYVTLTVRIGFAKEPILERFEVQRQSGNSPGIFITLTDQERQAVNTTVSVPDGGTVLIGGLKQVGEIEIEAGVPVLSKIPLLKRAFTNTTSVKDVQTLLILLKSKIIIQSEAEQEAFPTMQSVSLAN
jgi:general secretion pathway protein D